MLTRNHPQLNSINTVFVYRGVWAEREDATNRDNPEKCATEALALQLCLGYCGRTKLEMTGLLQGSGLACLPLHHVLTHLPEPSWTDVAIGLLRQINCLYYCALLQLQNSNVQSGTEVGVIHLDHSEMIVRDPAKGEGVFYMLSWFQLG